MPGENEDLEIDISTPAAKGTKPSLEQQLADTNARLDDEKAARMKAEGRAEGVAETLQVVGNREPVQQDQQPKRYTRAQLNAAVEAKQISVDDAEDILANQLRADITRDVTNTVSQSHSAQSTVQKISAEIDQYTAKFPTASVKGSKEHQALQKEYQKLRDLGQPQGLATELMAAKIVFGPMERVNLVRQEESNESHQEGGGGSGTPPVRRAKAADGTTVTLSARERAFYQSQIDKGIYKDMKEVGEMIANYGNPRIRERARQVS